MSKCRVCQRRKAVHHVENVTVCGIYFDVIQVCAKCRREEWPTSAEQRADDDAETYRSERQAEFDAESTAGLCDY